MAKSTIQHIKSFLQTIEHTFVVIHAGVVLFGAMAATTKGQ